MHGQKNIKVYKQFSNNTIQYNTIQYNTCLHKSTAYYFLKTALALYVVFARKKIKRHFHLSKRLGRQHNNAVSQATCNITTLYLRLHVARPRTAAGADLLSAIITK